MHLAAEVLHTITVEHASAATVLLEESGSVDVGVRERRCGVDQVQELQPLVLSHAEEAAKEQTGANEG